MSAASSGFNAIGSYMQSQQQIKLARQQGDLQRQYYNNLSTAALNTAAFSGKVVDFNLNRALVDLNLELRRTQSSVNVGFGSSGVNVGSGSALALQSSLLSKRDFSAKRLINSADIEKRRITFEAQQRATGFQSQGLISGFNSDARVFGMQQQVHSAISRNFIGLGQGLLTSIT